MKAAPQTEPAHSRSGPFFGKPSGGAFVQPKRPVGPAHDAFEREADRVADAAVRGGGFVQPRLRVNPALQRTCARCEADEKLQRKATGDVGTATPAVEATLAQPGQALDASTRTWAESNLGHDFSAVRIHTDAGAAQSATSIGARAYTSGHDVVFGAGEFSPTTDAGRHLLAHELAHVVQQGGGEGSIQRQVNRVEVNCASQEIRFEHDDIATVYALNACDVTDGEYNATVWIDGHNVHFELGETAGGTRFDFSYDILPGQPNPSTFFNGQSRVRVVTTHTAAGLGPGAALLPVSFESFPMLPSYLPLAGGTTSRLLAAGNLGWLTSGGGMRWGTMLGSTFWNPMNPFGRPGTTVLDRIITLGDGSTRAGTDLLLSLEPRLQSQLRAGGPYSWVQQRGFTEAELRSLEGLVRRMNAEGVSSLAADELALLRRAVQLHFDGAMAGSPFASYTPPGATAPFLDNAPLAGETRYRVRVRVDAASVLDGITPNQFNLGQEAYMNPGEFDMLVTTNAQNEIVSVQRVAQGREAPGWMMRNAGAVRWAGRLMLVGGAVMTEERIRRATPRERPRVIAEEAGGWGGGFLGAELGAGLCIAFGIATEGAGLLLCGLVGGAGLGFLGSHGAGAAVDAVRSPE